jgi:UDP-2-acetamido-3-amino-2,3-dideoxy-glucuronate N-acetyltransferase
VFLGPSAVFTNVINPRSFLERKTEYRDTLLKRGCSIGANATIICGVTLGAYCLIGAGAVVTKSVPDYALVVGNPARQMGWVSKYGHRLQFDETGRASCPESGATYQLEAGTVSEIN